MPKCSKTGKNKQAKPWVESSGNVFKDIGFSDEEAANLYARSILMLQIRHVIEQNDWTQVQAAKVLRVKQPRIAEIMKLKTELFSVDLLLKYLVRLGTEVSFQFKKSNVA
jgi:predicted XRE-type DNA-binding protein